jgi:hypothetical protein
METNHRRTKKKLKKVAYCHTFRHNKSRYTSGSDGRANSVTALVYVDFAMPAAPRLGGGKHAATTAHVTKGTLTRAVSTATSHTRDTCHSTTSTPRLSWSLMTCQTIKKMWSKQPKMTGFKLQEDEGNILTDNYRTLANIKILLTSTYQPWQTQRMADACSFSSRSEQMSRCLAWLGHGTRQAGWHCFHWLPPFRCRR